MTTPTAMLLDYLDLDHEIGPHIKKSNQDIAKIMVSNDSVFFKELPSTNGTVQSLGGSDWKRPEVDGEQKELTLSLPRTISNKSICPPSIESRKLESDQITHRSQDEAVRGKHDTSGQDSGLDFSENQGMVVESSIQKDKEDCVLPSLSTPVSVVALEGRQPVNDLRSCQSSVDLTNAQKNRALKIDSATVISKESIDLFSVELAKDKSLLNHKTVDGIQRFAENSAIRAESQPGDTNIGSDISAHSSEREVAVTVFACDEVAKVDEEMAKGVAKLDADHIVTAGVSVAESTSYQVTSMREPEGDDKDEKTFFIKDRNTAGAEKSNTKYVDITPIHNATFSDSFHENLLVDESVNGHLMKANAKSTIRKETLEVGAQKILSELDVCDHDEKSDNLIETAEINAASNSLLEGKTTAKEYFVEATDERITFLLNDNCVDPALACEGTTSDELTTLAEVSSLDVLLNVDDMRSDIHSKSYSDSSFKMNMTVASTLRPTEMHIIDNDDVSKQLGTDKTQVEISSTMGSGATVLKSQQSTKKKDPSDTFGSSAHSTSKPKILSAKEPMKSATLHKLVDPDVTNTKDKNGSVGSSIASKVAWLAGKSREFETQRKGQVRAVNDSTDNVVSSRRSDKDSVSAIASSTRLRDNKIVNVNDQLSALPMDITGTIDDSHNSTLIKSDKGTWRKQQQTFSHGASQDKLKLSSFNAKVSELPQSDPKFSEQQEIEGTSSFVIEQQALKTQNGVKKTNNSSASLQEKFVSCRQDPTSNVVKNFDSIKKGEIAKASEYRLSVSSLVSSETSRTGANLLPWQKRALPIKSNSGHSLPNFKVENTQSNSKPSFTEQGNILESFSNNSIHKEAIPVNSTPGHGQPKLGTEQIELVKDSVTTDSQLQKKAIFEKFGGSMRITKHSDVATSSFAKETASDNVSKAPFTRWKPKSVISSKPSELEGDSSDGTKLTKPESLGVGSR